jgi:hypothetical protein
VSGLFSSLAPGGFGHGDVQRRSAASGMGGGQDSVGLDGKGPSAFSGEALTARRGLNFSQQA